MNLARILLIGSMACSLASCALLSGDPVEEAQAHYDAQDYVSARGAVQDILARAPNNIPALELLARIQLAMGQGSEVSATLDRLEKAGGEPDDANLLAAEGLLQSGEAQAALALIGNRTDAEAWRLRALSAAMKGDNAQATEAFRQGGDANGDKAKLFAAEASYYLSKADWPAAARAVALAQKAAPKRIETLFVAARLAEVQDDHVLALSNFLRIIEIAPLDRPALIGAISAAERAEKPGVARHLIAYGAQTRPQDREFVYQEARVLAWDGKWEGVRAMLQQHEAEIADHDAARLLYAESLLQLGQVETARAIAAPVLARSPQNAEAMRVEAAIAAASQG
ncbi:tetratricopeptide repeat protein [Aurantiacibacter rhizosphaerae]|uniref:Tetratricopeptide repeat protein n=1 Tax=Aurantiacibacter rhizosphaerae TaxID=2691582 RepID=A0A844XEG5_9SPHN|nr:tetratricopeptide repeat protein [Aurantiacibacter rhizosphaerae]MWV27968.1 tetratricopeptide repeat protein [Aurantiacibacter rhizosphaerae]